MKMTIQWTRFASFVLLLTMTWSSGLWSIESARAQDKSGAPGGATPQTNGSLDLRGDLPHPRHIEASELRQLPRTEIRVVDPHDPSKQIVYSGTPLVEVLKAGGLLHDSNMAGMREAVSMTVLIEAADGYRAVFSLAELDPNLSDHVVLLADTKDGQPLFASEGPFRIIVPGEKRPARWVRQVKAVTVQRTTGTAP